ncbi:MAG TPA: flagellar motor protein MotB [Candidatus Binatia bacterium]|nr:flagellar motor protein MotB [Candidatus Binatia bacterium]
MAKPKDTTRIVVKKKKEKHAAHHGGAWKVAYADFVTAMMALFMVLWLLTQADVKLRSQIAQYFRDPGVLPGGSVLSQDTSPAHSRDPAVVERDVVVMHSNKVKTKHDREQEQQQKQEEQKKLEQQAAAVEQAIHRAATEEGLPAELSEHVVVEVTPAGLTIQVLDKNDSQSLLFDLSSADLKPALVGLLAKIAQVLGKIPNPVQVGGHTDSRPYAQGSAKSNWELSFERANNARRVLETKGLRAGQVNRVVAYADSRPFVPSDPLAAENRRLSILAERQRPNGDDEAGGQGPVTLPPDVVPERTALLDAPNRR